MHVQCLSLAAVKEKEREKTSELYSYLLSPDSLFASLKYKLLTRLSIHDTVYQEWEKEMEINHIWVTSDSMQGESAPSFHLNLSMNHRRLSNAAQTINCKCVNNFLPFFSFSSLSLSLSSLSFSLLLPVRSPTHSFHLFFTSISLHPFNWTITDWINNTQQMLLLPLLLLLLLRTGRRLR